MTAILLRHFLPVLFVALLAGCGAPQQVDDRGPSTCDHCEPEFASEARLIGCSQAAYAVELPTRVYDLPANFTDEPTAPTGAQLLLVNFNHCAQLRMGDETLTNVSLGYSGVRIHPPGRGPEVDVDIFDVEVLTDSGRLAEFLHRGGATPAEGTVSFTDSGQERRVDVGGDVMYTIMAEIPRIQGQSFEFRENHFAERGQSTWVSDCSFFEATAPVITQVGSGRLMAAAQAGLLVGHGGQPIECDITIDLW
ncbi:MAG TPA: hypothetical protein VM327_03260 [Candidatus Thermoplasmatota archaeon]|nr:hypothetical protein [Candidatus Thermoplasmatota archaeon]